MQVTSGLGRIVICGLRKEDAGNIGGGAGKDSYWSMSIGNPGPVNIGRLGLSDLSSPKARPLALLRRDGSSRGGGCVFLPEYL